MVKRLILLPIAFGVGWCVGGLAMIAYAAYRTLREMDRL